MTVTLSDIRVWATERLGSIRGVSPHLHRLEGFIDATVAIALTLLVLPLVDFASEVGDRPVPDVLASHRGELIAFVVSFLVIARFWRSDRMLLARVREVDDGLTALAFLWLLVIVLLPFVTAMLGAGGGPRPATTVLYLVTLAAGAGLGAAQCWWVGRRPALVAPPADGAALVGLQRRSVAATVLLLAAAVVASWLPDLALLMLLGLPLLGWAVDRRPPRPEGPVAGRATQRPASLPGSHARG